MNPTEFYKFCPKCGGSLNPQNANSLKCSECDFVFFINASVGVGAIICNDKGEILLIKRGKDPGRGKWDVPGGFVDPFTESMEQATVREAQEEVGIEIEVEEIISNNPNSYLYQGVNIPMLDVFLSAKWISGEVKADAEEVLEHGFFSPEEALKQDFWAEPIRQAIEKFVAK